MPIDVLCSSLSLLKKFEFNVFRERQTKMLYKFIQLLSLVPKFRENFLFSSFLFRDFYSKLSIKHKELQPLMARDGEQPIMHLNIFANFEFNPNGN